MSQTSYEDNRSNQKYMYRISIRNETTLAVRYAIYRVHLELIVFSFEQVSRSIATDSKDLRSLAIEILEKINQQPQ